MDKSPSDSLAPVATAGIHLVLSDITERRQAEEQHLDNARFRDAILDSIPSQIAVLDRNGTILAVNQTWRQFALDNSATPGELARNTQIGTNYLAICQGASADDADPDAASALQGILSVINGSATKFSLEYPCHSPTQQRWFSMAVTPLAIGDQAVVVTHTDITERKVGEAAIRDSDAFVRTMVETVPGMLAYWKRDLTCRFANSAYLSWFGRTAAEITEIPMQSLLGDALFQKNEPFVLAALAGENQQFERVLTKENGDVSYTWAQYIAHWKDGKVAGFLALVTDISEVKKAQLSLALSLQEKEALFKEVHHRVKNNLQIITSLLRMESRRGRVPEEVNVLKTMQGRIQTMAQLHESLYRSDSLASVDLGVYLGKIANQAFQTQLLNEMPVQLKLSMGTVPVGMDQAMVCGLLVNELVSNCLKHGFADGRAGEVRVELQPDDPATVETDARWRLRVSDTGVGLPPDFEDKRKTSLGLQLVDDLSQQAGGTLTIQSTPDAGADFSVVFDALLPIKLVMPE